MTQNNLYNHIFQTCLSQSMGRTFSDVELSYSGIHWPAIDEDLSFEGMFYNAGLCSLSAGEDNVYYIHP